MLLAIDTSTDWSGLALYDDQTVLGETTWRSARQHTEQLTEQLALLCKHTAVAPSAFKAVAVATGPGSWAGLRVGMSLAKGIAVAHGLPILGVSTTDVLAWPHRDTDATLVAVVRLGRSRYAAAVFPHMSEPCTEPSAPEAYDLAALPVVDGIYVGDVDEEVRGHIGRRGRVLSPALNLRRPAALAELAWLRWREGDVDDLVSLEPIYLSSPVRQLNQR